ncbi:MAG TPA: glycosyltransferase family 2 protein [Tepidisphaeraceae bacterium]|nr:glycosyltransferase family 2 protein [Tepidisphaeraceae bacterium]
MKISIVTPTLSGLPLLRQTAESILSQAGDFDLQWIVVDGGSTDGTVEWLSSLNDLRMTFTSERDKGQSDAINKGLAAADGDVVAWLNCDDLYVPGALAAVAGAFANHPDAQWLVGRYEVISLDGTRMRQGVVNYKRRRLERYSLSQLLTENIIPQPAVFWRRAFGERVGPLDLSLYYTMDYDLWLRMATVSPPLVIDDLLANFRHHATSKSGQLNRAQFDEQHAVMKRYTPSPWRRAVHRFHVEKVVWAYRLMRLIGR